MNERQDMKGHGKTENKASTLPKVPARLIEKNHPSKVVRQHLKEDELRRVAAGRNLEYCSPVTGKE